MPTKARIPVYNMKFLFFTACLVLLLECCLVFAKPTGVKIEHDEALIELGVKGDVSLQRKSPGTLHINANVSLPGLTKKTCVIQTGRQENGGVLLKEIREGMTLVSCT